MVKVFRMPPAEQTAFEVLPTEGPRILQWLASKLKKWGRSTRYEVHPNGIRIRGTLYGRRIRRKDLLLESVERLELTETDPRSPKLRTNGIGLPGYSAGWFRLNSGEKALVFVTDPKRVVYIPTRRSYALLLSVDDPEGFVTTLKETLPQHERSA